MNASDYPDAPAARPIWLVTLADMALLLLGFFVLIQATGDRRALAGGLRNSFGGSAAAAATATQAEAPMPVAAMLTGFAVGSAAPQDPDAMVAWAREAVRDPRISLSIAGATDGTAADVDPATGSHVILAADRARAVAALLAPVTQRIVVTTDPAARHRSAIVTIAFTGDKRNQP
jgi:flagellar motor protein MotB